LGTSVPVIVHLYNSINDICKKLSLPLYINYNGFSDINLTPSPFMLVVPSRGFQHCQLARLVIASTRFCTYLNGGPWQTSGGISQPSMLAVLKLLSWHVETQTHRNIQTQFYPS